MREDECDNKTAQDAEAEQGKGKKTVGGGETVESPPKMDFDAAVKLGKNLAAATIQSNKMWLGELADRVQKKITATRNSR